MNTTGFCVPVGFAISTDALDHYLASNGLSEHVSAALKRFDGLSFEALGGEPARLREHLLDGTLPDDLVAELRQALNGLNDAPVALRSSSTLEDRANFSFAGQHDSRLNIQGFEECIEALKTVWVSLYGDRAISYLRALGHSTQPLRMGVAVQTTVPAQVAGVAFTMHPVNGNYDHIYISAALGLGEATVSGEVTPDKILVGHTKRETLRYTVGSKASKIVGDEAGGRRCKYSKMECWWKSTERAARFALSKNKVHENKSEIGSGGLSETREKRRPYHQILHGHLSSRVRPPNNRRLLIPACDNPRPCIDIPDDGFGRTGMQKGHAVFAHMRP